MAWLLGTAAPAAATGAAAAAPAAAAAAAPAITAGSALAGGAAGQGLASLAAGGNLAAADAALAAGQLGSGALGGALTSAGHALGNALTSGFGSPASALQTTTQGLGTLQQLQQMLGSPRPPGGGDLPSHALPPPMIGQAPQQQRQQPNYYVNPMGRIGVRPILPLVR